MFSVVRSARKSSQHESNSFLDSCVSGVVVPILPLQTHHKEGLDISHNFCNTRGVRDERTGGSMAHFGNGLETRKSTPGEWLRTGAQIGTLVNDWSFRTDLVVNLGDSTVSGAPAAFNPKSAEVEVNTKVAFGNVSPDEIGDLTKRKHQLLHPTATGAIFHEALHARFSRWSIEHAQAELTRDEFSALFNLEEGRIEAFGIRTNPNNKLFLRSSALNIVVADLENQVAKITNVAGASFLSALTLARVDAGVLDASDVEPVVPIVEQMLGAEVIAKLRAIWIEFQAHDNHADATRLYELAREWVKVVNETKAEKGETGNAPHPGCHPTPSPSGESGSSESGSTPSGESGSGSESGESESETGSGSGSSESEESESGESESGSGSSPLDEIAEQLAKEILEALNEARENAEIATRSDADEQIESEEWKEIAQDKANSAKEAKAHRDVSASVFGAGTGPSPEMHTNSRLIEVRKPTGEERASAVRVARLLEKAKYRERSQVEINSEIPVGRLRSRAMVQKAAYKAIGVNAKVEPWRSTKRKHTDNPELNVGVMVDISGSMGSAMQPMATTAWVLSEAVRRVQGKASMVYYGSDVFATLKPGQHLEDVNVYTARDNTEKFDKAFKALDGSMNLLHGSGARLLVVVSDGYYTYEERENAKKWLGSCKRNGVGVLWLAFEGSETSQLRYILNGSDAVRIDVQHSASASSIATLIGESAARALTVAGKRNG